MLFSCVDWFQSGAIMCLLGAVCVTHPDARLSIAFVGDLFPHSFSASSVGCVCSVNLVVTLAVYYL